MNQEYSLISILSVLSKWKRYILYGTLGVSILSAIILLMMPNYYRASSSFYAASPDLSKPAPVGSAQINSYIYGNDNDLDRLFSIAKSTEIYNKLIDKYNLYEHYGINPEGKKAQSLVRLKLGSLYKTLKTEYGAINLSIEDTDPVQARDMVNDTRIMINDLSQKMVKKSQYNMLQSYEKNMIKKQSRSIMLNDSLALQKAKYSILDSRTQAELYAELITKSEASMDEVSSKVDMYKNSRVRGAADSVRVNQIKFTSMEKKVASLNQKVQGFNQGVVIVNKLELELLRLNDQISMDKERMLQLQGAYEAPYSAILIVDEATTPLEKSRPGRTLLLLLITMASLVLCTLIAFLLESYYSINWSEIKS